MDRVGHRLRRGHIGAGAQGISGSSLSDRIRATIPRSRLGNCQKLSNRICIVEQRIAKYFIQ